MKDQPWTIDQSLFQLFLIRLSVDESSESHFLSRNVLRDCPMYYTENRLFANLFFDKKRETENWKLKTENWKLKIENWKLKILICESKCRMCHILLSIVYMPHSIVYMPHSPFPNKKLTNSERYLCPTIGGERGMFDWQKNPPSRYHT